MVMLNKIHCYIKNFMLYKMIYFLSHKIKFTFSNLHFSPFYEHFPQFDHLIFIIETYTFTLCLL